MKYCAVPGKHGRSFCTTRKAKRHVSVVISMRMSDRLTQAASSQTLRKRQEAAVILLTRAHCYATHYLSQNR